MSRDVVLLDLFTCCVAPASSNQMGSRPRITRDMIGDPLKDSFQHVAHVGAGEVGDVDSVEPFKSRFAPSSSPQSSSESSRLPSPTAAPGAQQQMLKMNSKGTPSSQAGLPPHLANARSVSELRREHAAHTPQAVAAGGSRG